MSKIYVIHENEDWVIPLRKSFEKLNLPYEEWFIDDIDLDLNSTPPEGVFYNRMSASAHTRLHRYSPEITGTILAWLELHGRVVINGRHALQLELRKSEQYLGLQSFSIPHPQTRVVNNIKLLPKAANELGLYPFIVKPNRGGKGAGVQLFQSAESLANSIEQNQLGESLDGIWLIQEYIKPASGRITRAEFVGGKFLYAVSIDASNGFELCPADACNLEDIFCPADQNVAASKFKVLDDYENPDLERYAQFLKKNNIGIGALEYAMNEDGIRVVYDINTNTNYNSAAEAESAIQKQGMFEIAKFLGVELSSITPVSI
jgi:hypothetical protein